MLRGAACITSTNSSRSKGMNGTTGIHKKQCGWINVNKSLL